MLKIALCEDDEYDMTQAKKVLYDIKNKMEISCEIMTYQCGQDVIDAMHRGVRFELILLDIYLKHDNGIDIARAIQAIQKDCIFVFLTVSRDFALEAYELNAIHYILKPIKEIHIQEIFQRYFDRLHKPMRFIQLYSESKSYEFAIQNIIKIQSENKGVIVFLANIKDPVRIAVSFKKIEEQITDKSLIKITRGFIVNLNFIVKIHNSDTCILKDGTNVLISRKIRPIVREKYYDYIFKSIERSDEICH